jgi:hypothetical protein
MKNLLMTTLVLGLTFCFLTANATQENRSKHTLSDTTGVQKNKSKKLLPKQKIKEDKPINKELNSSKIDTFKRFIPERPLLRLKDSSQNNSH